MFDKYSDKDGCLGAIGLFLITVVLLAGLYLLEAWIGQWLWNDVVNIPAMFDNTKLELGFWQTYGLIWLAHIIFPGSSKFSSSKD